MTEARPNPALRSLFDPLSRIVGAVVPTVVGAVDVDELLSRIDVNVLLSRIDVNELMSRIDLDALLSKIDLDQLMSKIDVDSILERVDIDLIMQRADLAGIVAQSTRGITARSLDLVRRQLAGIDAIVTRVAARLLRRKPDLDPTGPPTLQGIDPSPTAGPHGLSISGHYAGPVARVAALSLDWFTLVFLFSLMTATGGWILGLLFHRDGSDVTLSRTLSIVMFVTWELVYFAVPLALIGRTLGKAVVGLRVVRRDGRPLPPAQAVVRVLVLPLSFALLGLGLIGALFGRQRRTLHDLAAGSVEVTDWGDRPAALPSPLSNWLASRQADQAIVVTPTEENAASR